MTLRVLIIGDELDLCDQMRLTLSACQHHVTATLDAAEGLYHAARGSWDVLVVANCLMRLGGLKFISTVRRHDRETSLLLLVKEAGEKRRNEALRAGADSCLVRPFSMSELEARVEALGLRRRAVSRAVLRIGDLEINTSRRTVRRDNMLIVLQLKDFRLLEFLVRHAGEIVTREMLLEGVWGYKFDPHTNIIETHISRLRSRIDAGFSHNLIHTIRGIGYCLRSTVDGD